MGLRDPGLRESALARLGKRHTYDQKIETLKSANLTGCSREQSAVQATYSNYPFLPVFRLARA